MIFFYCSGHCFRLLCTLSCSFCCCWRLDLVTPVIRAFHAYLNFDSPSGCRYAEDSYEEEPEVPNILQFGVYWRTYWLFLCQMFWRHGRCRHCGRASWNLRCKEFNRERRLVEASEPLWRLLIPGDNCKTWKLRYGVFSRKWKLCSETWRVCRFLENYYGRKRYIADFAVHTGHTMSCGSWNLIFNGS